MIQDHFINYQFSIEFICKFFIQGFVFKKDNFNYLKL